MRPCAELPRRRRRKQLRSGAVKKWRSEHDDMERSLDDGVFSCSHHLGDLLSHRNSHTFVRSLQEPAVSVCFDPNPVFKTTATTTRTPRLRSIARSVLQKRIQSSRAPWRHVGSSSDEFWRSSLPRMPLLCFSLHFLVSSARVRHPKDNTVKCPPTSLSACSDKFEIRARIFFSLDDFAASWRRRTTRHPLTQQRHTSSSPPPPLPPSEGPLLLLEECVCMREGGLHAE
ncbi:hypothetical protein F2P81_014309 [Scophthalmus maximus]|uniref:Uncharacterized protein n=1 Tax=Scophthalmus maximus TaxID=52904 RepID=A0A6A4SJF2_SCOMX|nr:hypothetical protein F2P81_014309 [Scophthalmus maximus]